MASGFWAVLVAHREARWDALRDIGRVVKMGGVYHMTRRDDVIAALHNTKVFSSARRKSPSIFRDMIGLPPIPTALDPPEHTRYRELLQPLFSPQAPQELEPRFAELAAMFVHGVAGAGECDAMSAVAIPYATACLQMFWGCRWKTARSSPGGNAP
jgi:hypothetical protein